MPRFNLILGSTLSIGVVVAMLAVSAGQARSLPSKAPPASPPHPVRLAHVERGSMSHPIRATGVIRAKNELDLGFLVGGQVAWVGVDVGSNVHRGQPLARIDATQIAADADRARAAAVKARRDLDRVSALEKSGALPQATLDDAQTGDTIANAQQRSAEFALHHGVLLAPDDGVIDARLVDAGEMVSPGQPVIRLSSRSRGAVVRIYLSDRDVLGLDVGRGAVVSLDATPDETLTARVSQIATAASPASGDFEVELRLDAAPSRFKSGMTAKVEVQRVKSVGSAVPITALVPGDTSGASVVAVANGLTHRIPVHVLFFEGSDVALQESLTGVTDVATAGVLALGEGTRVKEAVP